MNSDNNVDKDKNVVASEGHHDVLKMKHKKKRPAHQEAPEEGEGWLVSYADLMTVLCCFFILMVSMANFDPPKFGEKMEKVSEHFDAKKSENKKSETDKVVAEIKTNPVLNQITTIEKDVGQIKVTFKGSALFDSGSADLKPDADESIEALVNIIKEKNPDYRILVEGHTDSVPINTEKFRSNWELSSVRSARILAKFEDAKFKKDQLLAIGYGETRPVAPNVDAKGNYISANMQLNRRVVVKITDPPSKNMVKIGLGNYFDDSAVKYEHQNPKPAPVKTGK